MSQICPSVAQDAAALWIAMKTVMSWQPGTFVVSCGWERTLAPSGLFSGTWTIEIFLNGAWQLGPLPPGYDEMYRSTRLFARSGTSVCVCDPQSVYTDAMRTGFAGSDRSKIRIPSKHGGPQAVVSLLRTVLQTVAPFVCGVSFDRKRRSRPLAFQSETSFCGPRHGK